MDKCKDLRALVNKYRKKKKSCKPYTQGKKEFNTQIRKKFHKYVDKRK